MNRQLVADVGNTETVVGLLGLSGGEVLDHWRLSTRSTRTAAEYRVLLSSLLGSSPAAQGAAVARAVVASVVPAATPALVRALSALAGEGRVFVVTASSGLPIRLDVDEPLSVGADRIVNTLAAKARFGRDVIAVDLGTATTFDCITADGVFRGGVIAPGLRAGLQWLAESTAKLPPVELAPPETVVGRRTETCVQSGVFYSAVDAVDGIVARIKESWAGADPLVVATGGFASVVGPFARSVDRIEPLLTLQGLGIAGAHLARSRRQAESSGERDAAP